MQATYKENVTEVRKQRIIVGKKLISEETNPYGLDSDGDPVIPKLLIGHDRSYQGYFVGPTYRAIEIARVAINAAHRRFMSFPKTLTRLS